ncbi:quinone oxidoreductase family protein [Methylocella silvestris]|uniref:Enoyl reductase (ER) domain-containing protein n=1 Tax=Methylocella silvestris TaxID=199596 RepID=A0A2J7TBX3_METSI|nr:zinc-binding dehydrogenase [Methylocella silvestris]PNG24271.1 hypothetical protein CR492_19600 [Methylocella silvestris]
MSNIEAKIPEYFNGVGYAKEMAGLPLQAIRVPVPKPGIDEVLIHVFASSLNPLEYKLAELNFFGRTPPVILGFDIAGVVVATGAHVTGLKVGDEVTAMADCNGNGGWAVGGEGGYALAREYLTVKKPFSLSFRGAAVLPIGFLAAFLGLYGHVKEGDSVYIPGGGGGVGHLAVQMARTLGASLVISSGGNAESRALALASGAHVVLDYREDDVGAKVMALTDGRGVDVVFDLTYSESSFVQTAELVARGGIWVVLGVGPGRTTRRAVTESPVNEILERRGAAYANANVLRFYTDPATLDDKAKSLLQLAMKLSMEWAENSLVVPHIGKTIGSTTSEINEELQNMKSGKAPLGKIAVIVDLRSAGTERA